LLTLALTLAGIGVALWFFQPFPLAFFIAPFIIGLGLNYLIIQIFFASLKRNAVQVSEIQFPELKALVEECRDYVHISADTQIFVSYDPLMNAFAIGFGRPYNIVIHSALLEALDRDELKFVIGHEMGHIKFKHTVLLILIGQLGKQTYYVPIIGALIQLIFLFWSRAGELTADRAGLIACGRLDKAISAHVKLMAGSGAGRQVNLTALAQQASEARGFLGMLNEVIGSHPLGTTRIQRLVDFAASETFRHLRPDVDPTFSAEPTSGPPLFPAGGSAGVSGQSSWPTAGARRDASFFASALPLAPPTTRFREPVVEIEPVQPLPEIAFDRLNLAIARANLEQAEGWLRLAELFQQHGQAGQADQYRQQAQGLLASLTSPLAPETGLMVKLVGSPCPSCSQANPPESPCCHHCQRRLLEPCLSCQAWLAPGSDTCKRCGQNQVEAIQAYKAEASEHRQIVKQPIPPAWPPRWQIIYSLVFLIDLSLVTFGFARQMGGGSAVESLMWTSLPYMVLLVGLMIGFDWLKRLAGKRRYVLGQIELSIKRYNEISDILALRQVSLRPARLMTKDEG
jgi:Zn-dependent protease with chaperone function